MLLASTSALIQLTATAADVQVHRAFLGTMELVAILAVVVLLFGANKLPQLGKGLGEAIGNFKKASREGEQAAMRDEIDATPKVDGRPSDRIAQDRQG